MRSTQHWSQISPSNHLATRLGWYPKFNITLPKYCNRQYYRLGGGWTQICVTLFSHHLLAAKTHGLIRILWLAIFSCFNLKYCQIGELAFFETKSFRSVYISSACMPASCQLTCDNLYNSSTCFASATAAPCKVKPEDALTAVWWCEKYHEWRKMEQYSIISNIGPSLLAAEGWHDAWWRECEPPQNISHLKQEKMSNQRIWVRQYAVCAANRWKLISTAPQIYTHRPPRW